MGEFIFSAYLKFHPVYRDKIKLLLYKLFDLSLSKREVTGKQKYMYTNSD